MTRPREQTGTRLDLVVLGVIAFILEYDLPYAWFRPPDLIAQNRDSLGSGQTAALLLVTVTYGIFASGLDFGSFLRHMRREWLLPAYLGLAALSSLWSVHPFITFSDAVSLIVCLLITYWAYDRLPLRDVIAVLGWVFGIGAVASAVMVKALPQYGASALGWTGLLKNRNEFGQSVVLGFLILVLCARLHRRYRVLAYGGAALCAVLVLGSTSKTSLVALVAMPTMLITFAVFRARRTLYAAVAIVMSLAGTIVFIVAMRLLPVVTDALDRSTNLSGRTEIWSEVARQIRRRPWVGYGYHGYWTDPYGVAKVTSLRYGPLPHAHNALLESALNLGLVGAVMLVALFLRLIIRGARVVRHFEGVAGLFPLAVAGYVLLICITEVQVFERSLKFVVFAFAVTAAARGRRDALDAVWSNDRPGRSQRAVRS